MTRNSKDLESFTAYCNANPTQRFWQALRNWAKVESIWIRRKGELPLDTFHIENAIDFQELIRKRSTG